MNVDTDRLNSEFDLVAFASRYVSLVRRGLYYIGPCPMCGGEDRFTIKTAGSRQIWLCRGCSRELKYEDAISFVMQFHNADFQRAIEIMGGGEEISEERLREIERRKEAEEEQRKAEIDARLAKFSTGEIWDALHRRMTEEHRAWWRKQGIPDDWQDYLCLGYEPEKTFYVDKENLATSPAYTIPYFHYDARAETHKTFKTMQYRLVEPPKPNDKYRFEQGLGTTYYMVTPTVPVGGNVIVCEGAKKGIVTHLRGGGKGVTVLATPSKTDFGEIAETLKTAQRVWVVFDPDAYERSVKLAKEIGPNARVVEMPMKIDDAFLRGGLTRKLWLEYLRQAVKVQ